MESNFCLFCTSPCSKTFTIVDGQIAHFKTELDDDHKAHAPPGSSSSPFSFADEEGSPLIGEQLKVIFILRNILGLKEETLCEYLGRLEGALHPQFWLQVCSPCEESVSEYYRVLKDFLQLEKKLKAISNELKSRIFETEWRDVNSDDGGEVRKKIRAEVLKEFSQTYLSSQAEKNKSDQHSFSNLTLEDERLGDPLASLVKQEPETEYYAAEEEEMLITGDIVPENDDDYDVEMPITTVQLFASTEVSNCGQFVRLETGNKLESSRGSSHNPGSRHSSQIGVQIRAPNMLAKSSTSMKIGDVLVRENEAYATFKRDGCYLTYRCKKCPLRFTEVDTMKAHLELHKEGSGAVTCEICKWVLYPDRLELHNRNNHGKGKK